ncbi:MAG TPA: SURF1 family protein, partial [Novosphingobium sp.]|nr:SURF1 family protein [Novosphingobium sp.]
RYEAAQSLSSAVPWPRDATERETALFRHSRIVCERVLAQGATAGHSFTGETGWAHTARCALDGGGEAEVVLGWSRDPRTAARWDGGEALGEIAPGGALGARLIAAPPLAGLEPSARPDPRDVSNNHLAYAVQWFFFAITAAVVYLLALRKRLAGERDGG